MYSREKRMRAIELYIKYEKSAADVIRELGYPDRKTLREWYRMYLVEQETGVLHERVSKYSPEAKEAAVRHYLEHGRRISRTIRAMGYPSRETFRKWCNELIPDWCKKRSGGVRYAHGQEKETTATPPVRNTAKEDAVRMVSNRQNPRLPDKEVRTTMPAAEDKHSSISKEELLSEIESLRKQNKKLRLERDILKATAEIIKKDPGVDQKKLTNREKALVIGALRKDHPLKDLLECMAMSRSSFFYQRQCLLAGDKYKKLKERITILFEANGRRYGYRRIHALLLREGIRVSEKVVRRCMAECSLIVFGRKRRRYSAYQGEKTPAARNLLKRDFHAERPNAKWLTDITEFHLPAGKVYLSPIIDCYDGLVVSWTIGTSPDADLVNSMLDQAMATLKAGERPIVHSDRGAHYRWPGWLARMEEANLLRSMSKKGCSPDNAACEGFFGRLKTEMFYNRKWFGVSIAEFMDILNRYLHWYNEQRIKMSLGAMSPLEYRRSLNLAA
jgi:transposase InsO family protein/transposase-like protein